MSNIEQSEPPAYRAEVAMDAVRGLKPKTKTKTPQDVLSLAGQAPKRTETGQDWRWWQDYGGGSHSKTAVQKELLREPSSGLVRPRHVQTS